MFLHICVDLLPGLWDNGEFLYSINIIVILLLYRELFIVYKHGNNHLYNRTIFMCF